MKITVELDNGHVQTFADGQIEDCIKAAAWESAYEELQTEAKEAKLERENLSLKQELDTVRSQRAEVCEAKAQEVQNRMALEKELRDAQEKLDNSVRRETRLMLEADQLRHRAEEMKTALDKRVADYKQETKALRERIQEQDVTIAMYDDENRKLKAKYIAWDRGSTALTRWARAIHENAVAHGWWAQAKSDGGDFRIDGDGDRPFGEIIALCHSELSEALEEYRNGKPNAYIVGGQYGELCIEEPEKWGDHKPEGVAVEMIDCIIRILDWCGKESIDVDGLIRKKHEYNKTRPYRHGGKKL